MILFHSYLSCAFLSYFWGVGFSACKNENWEKAMHDKYVSGGTGTSNQIFRYPESAEKWVEHSLSSFLPNFAKYLTIFKVSQHLQCAPLWKIIKYGKKWRKPCSTCLQPISSRHCRTVPKTQVSGIGYLLFLGEMGWRQVKQGISSFFAIFCHIWWFYKVEHTEGVAIL